jgi:hypothetical protein
MRKLISRRKGRTSNKGCEKRVLITIFVRKGEGIVTEDWKKLYSEELYDFFCPSDIKVIS